MTPSPSLRTLCDDPPITHNNLVWHVMFRVTISTSTVHHKVVTLYIPRDTVYDTWHSIWRPLLRTVTLWPCVWRCVWCPLLQCSSCKYPCPEDSICPKGSSKPSSCPYLWKLNRPSNGARHCVWTEELYTIVIGSSLGQHRKWCLIGSLYTAYPIIGVCFTFRLPASGAYTRLYVIPSPTQPWYWGWGWKHFTYNQQQPFSAIISVSASLLRIVVPCIWRLCTGLFLSFCTAVFIQCIQSWSYNTKLYRVILAIEWNDYSSIHETE